MKGWDIALGEMDPALRQRIAEAQGTIRATAKPKPCEDKGEPAERFKGPENALQRQCEGWLQHMGYWASSPKFIAAAPPPSGWYLHLHEARSNPIMPDLLILRNDGHFLPVELKKDKGRISDHQKTLIEHGWKLAYSIDEFIQIVNEWEERLNHGHC